MAPVPPSGATAHITAFFARRKDPPTGVGGYGKRIPSPWPRSPFDKLRAGTDRGSCPWPRWRHRGSCPPRFQRRATRCGGQLREKSPLLVAAVARPWLFIPVTAVAPSTSLVRQRSPQVRAGQAERSKITSHRLQAQIPAPSPAPCPGPSLAPFLVGHHSSGHYQTTCEWLPVPDCPREPNGHSCPRWKSPET